MNLSTPTVYSFNTFTSAEAETITGLPATVQRDWRRRGIIPAVEGHARYTLVDLAKIKILKAMTDGGVAQYLREELAPLCTYGLVKMVLENDGNFPMSRIYEGPWQVWFNHPFPTRSAFVDASQPIPETWAEYHKRMALDCQKNGDLRSFSAYTAKEIARHITVDQSLFSSSLGWGNSAREAKDLLIITGGNTPHWVWPRELADEFEGADSVRRALEETSGVMLHLRELAYGMTRKTVRPFVKILLPAEVSNG